MNILTFFRVVIPQPTSLLTKVWLALVLLVGAPLAQAHWQSTTYTLRGGWNAIYLHGDATHATPDELFAGSPEVLAVWRWNPHPDQTQFADSPLIPAAGSADWNVWDRATPAANTLTALTGQTAYLIRCAGSAATTYSVPIVQKVIPPRGTWVRNGANLLGFPTLQNAGNFPLFSTYFSTFPPAIAANTRIYTYAGGELGPANPVQVFSPAATPLDRNKAYWFEATVVGTYYAPLEITTSHLEGLIFGRTGHALTVRVRNRTAAAVTLRVEPVASLPAPAGQEDITGAVPLTLRTLNSTTGTYTDTALNSAFTQVVGPQSSIELSFGVDRAQMTGAVDALYASLLRFTESSNLLDISLPVSARVASLAGLWVGDVELAQVVSKAPGSPGSTTPRSYPLRVLLHVDEAGTARLLSQVFLGRLAAAPHNFGLCTRESGLKPDAKADATRLVSVTLPLDTEVATGSGSVALGATLVRSITVPFDARTNPFVHTYHPDHDNKDARGVPLSAGRESYTISRECRFTFATTPPTGLGGTGWGATVLGGTYTEIVTGLHKTPITAFGTFQLRRVSEIGSITLN